MTTQKKIIAVVGATGAQGGGLAHAILANRESPFAVRAITRKTDGEKALALAKLGAEVVAADIDDPKSVARAFEGAHGAFCLTNFWEHFSAERELHQAKALADAARAAKVGHVIWSTLEDTRLRVPLDDDRMPTLQGKYKVPHFDAKGEADAYFADLPTTYLLTSFYWDNFVYFGMGPKRGPDGKLGIAFPLGTAKLPGIAADDIGPCALGVFAKGAPLVGRRVGIAGEHLSGSEMAAALGKAVGEAVTYHDVPPATYRAFGFPGADDLGNMFQYKRDFESDFRAPRDVAGTRALHPGTKSFAQWLEGNASKIPLG